jgi:hypothetical protein
VPGNYLTGLILHQLAIPDLRFDPVGKITALLESLVKAAGVINATAVTGAHCAPPGAPGPAVAGDELATLRSAASVPGRGRAAGSAP